MKWLDGLDSYRLHLLMCSPPRNIQSRLRRNPPFKEEQGDHFLITGPQSSRFLRAPQLSPRPTGLASLPRLASWRLSQHHFEAEGTRATKWWAETRASLRPPSAAPVSSYPALGPAAIVAMGLSSTPRSPVFPHVPHSPQLTEPHPSPEL